METKKKVIVITGGNSGLGKATAKILVQDNKIVILGKNEEEVKATAEEFNCEGIICDVTNPEQIKNAFSQILDKHKKVDCLINCAGVWIEGPIEENDPESIKNAMLVNATGTILITNAIVSQMKKQNSGRIINIISQAGLYGKPNRSVYNASKWAITGFTKSIQMELAPFDISVVGFYPGFIHTNLFGKAEAQKTDFSTAMSVEQPAKALAYLVNVDADIVIREFGMQSIRQFK